MPKFILPDAPADQTGPVKAWNEAVTIPTYLPMPADRNPMFLERRVYQGSSGRVYPLPFVDRIAEEKVDRAWQAIHIENQFVRLMILPEIGGRIHVGMDKTNGYDFFYRQNVIKPALVGLAGPWISGGVEFNWPQHHRPSTFMPVQTHIERHEDGSVTVWCSEHEPMNRMKGMHGVCLHPDRAVIELKVRLYNRTELVQTFLWWANVATRVHERYQSFFPPDVYYVADHAKRAMSRYPKCEGFYYGVNYGARAKEGISPEQMPSNFVPPGDYEPNDLSWYANIPVPTSYMCMGTKEDFFGGYDHAAEAGVVHVASHHVSPGKKQWTWGNHEFGYAWDRNLTDEDGPYIELMAGVFTDNQPDFSFLHPGETRTFSQFWYPIQRIGPARKANVEAAVSLSILNHDEHKGRQKKRELRTNLARVGVAVTGVHKGAVVRLERKGKKVWEETVDLGPDRPLVREVEVGKGLETELRLSVRDGEGRVLIEYQPAERKVGQVPPAASEPAMPTEMKSIEELYLTGLHLEQYRHATRLPEMYWREALGREPSDVRCNNAMGLWHLRRGEFPQAEEHFRRAIETLTRRNPNPRDGESFYNLGLALRYMGRFDEAYDAFYKATWDHAWQSAAFYALGELDLRKDDEVLANDHLWRSVEFDVKHSRAWNLIASWRLRRGLADPEMRSDNWMLYMDPLDPWARYVEGKTPGDTQICLDLALDHARAGLYEDALEILEKARAQGLSPGTAPLVHYYELYFERCMGKEKQHGRDARATSNWLDYCFPARLEEIAILQSAIDRNPRDWAAPYLLGNLFYDRRRHEEAIGLWEESAKLKPTFSIVWRNLGIAYFNVRKQPGKAKAAYDRALKADPSDARVLFERDQLWKRMGIVPARRLKELMTRMGLVQKRDDFSVELCALFNQTGQHEKALHILQTRKFQPWEGGEGQALGQHVRTHLALGRKALAAGDPANAKSHFEAALQSPQNLGEARHVLANQSDVWYRLGVACDATGDRPAARRWWEEAARFKGDFQEMSVRSFSEMSYYSALSLQKLGRKAEATALLRGLLKHAKNLRKSHAKIDYFATSLPAMLLFEDNLQRRQAMTADLLEAQAYLGMGKTMAARRLLSKILKVDPSHALAADLLAVSGRMD